MDPLYFLTSIQWQIIKQIEVGPFGGKNREKSPTLPKKTGRMDPLVSPGIVYYAEKEEILFLFKSLGQMIQFGTIKFRRTFKNYFAQFAWFEKNSHYSSRVSLYEAPTKKLNTLFKSQ